MYTCKYRDSSDYIQIHYITTAKNYYSSTQSRTLGLCQYRYELCGHLILLLHLLSIVVALIKEVARVK